MEDGSTERNFNVQTRLTEPQGKIKMIYQPLDDFRIVELPEKQLPFWKIAGPGAILVGLSIGAGESVIWPLIAAEYGGSMIWAAVLGVFLQLWINFEVGRWTIATGETVYTGYITVSGAVLRRCSFY